MSQPKYQLYLRGYTGGWNFDADYIDYVVDKNAGKRLDVLISSPGGSLATALRVSAAFARHGDVHVHYSGMNASAATIAGMGAKEITIDDVGAFWLVHKSSVVLDIYRQMNSDDMAGLIENIQKRIHDHETIDAQIAKMYAKRCKRSPEDLANLMSEEKWITPEEALAWGFVDKILESESKDAEKVPESVVCAIREAGLPELPKVCRKSITDQIADAIGGALEACGLKKPAAKSEEKEDSSIQNSDKMEKEKSTPEVTASEVENAAETTQIEASTPETKEDPQVAALKAELAKANARIAELEAAPGAETSKVIENSRQSSNEGSPIDTLFADLSGARNLMASIGR